jgi:bifunctional DNA-binding transcriptional regulator/antitoxin component of YhaV-PrlF toxin-antitoxin module
VKIRVKNGRFWIPVEYLKNARINPSDFVCIKIKKNKRVVGFISKISEKRDKRVVIPKDKRRELDLREEDRVIVSIDKLKNRKRPKKFIRANKIDLLAFVPCKTLKGYDILADVVRGSSCYGIIRKKADQKSLY